MVEGFKSNFSFIFFHSQRSARRKEYKSSNNVFSLLSSLQLRWFEAWKGFKNSLVFSIFFNSWISRNFSVIWAFVPFLGHLIIRPMYKIILHKHMSRFIAEGNNTLRQLSLRELGHQPKSLRQVLCGSSPTGVSIVEASCLQGTH